MSEISINITVNGEKIELPIEEARHLFIQLKEIFGEDTNPWTLPTPIYPDPLPPTDYPDFPPITPTSPDPWVWPNTQPPIWCFAGKMD